MSRRALLAEQKALSRVGSTSAILRDVIQYLREDIPSFHSTLGSRGRKRVGRGRGPGECAKVMAAFVSSLTSSPSCVRLFTATSFCVESVANRRARTRTRTRTSCRVLTNAHKMATFYGSSAARRAASEANRTLTHPQLTRSHDALRTVRVRPDRV